jgi:hypothetical protein
MTEEQFNKWWKDNRHRLLHEDKEYAERENSYKIKSGADLLLFAIPALAGIIFLESGLVKHEMLNWLCAAIVVIVTFLISAFIKSQMIPGDSLYDIEQRIRQQIHDEKVDAPEKSLRH